MRRKEILSARQRVEKNLPGLIDALAVSLKNIEKYHKTQLEMGQRSWMVENGPGRKFGQKSVFYKKGQGFIYQAVVICILRLYS